MNWTRCFDSTDIKILFYLHEHGETRYFQLLDKIGKTRGALASSLRDLKRMKLIDRIVNQTTTPLEVTYKLTDKGEKAVRLLDELRKLIT